jgi:hypothetical protein
MGPTLIARRFHLDGVEHQAAAIGILNEEGLRALRRCGHEAVARASAPGLPSCNVRFVDVSRLQELEITPDTGLGALYAMPFPGRPVVTGTRVTEGPSVTIDLRVPPDLGCLRGHFPALPVVPAVVQLGWVLEFGAEILGRLPAFRAVRSVKFQRIIQPGHSLRLHIAAETGRSGLRFEYASEAGRYSAGIIETRGAGD